MPPAPRGEMISNGPSLVPEANGIVAGIIALELRWLVDFLVCLGIRMRRAKATPGIFVSAHSKGVILPNLVSAHSKGVISPAECALTSSLGGDGMIFLRDPVAEDVASAKARSYAKFLHCDES